MTANGSSIPGSSNSSQAQFSLVNIDRFAAESGIDPAIGSLTRNAARGEQAYVNLTQVEPGRHFGAHYHEHRDEIDYVLKGQANMTVAGQNYPVAAGDLMYIPPYTVHDFEGTGDENLELLCIFAPPYDGTDRIYV